MQMFFLHCRITHFLVASILPVILSLTKHLVTNTGYEMFSCECLWDVRVSGRAAFVMHTSNCVNFQCDIIFITS